MSPTLIAFDLDDTLYKECDYVMSGYMYVAGTLARRLRVPPEMLVEVMTGGDSDSRHPFDRLHDYLDGAVSVDSMVAMYREHQPVLTLPDATRECLDRLSDAGYTLALITDGRHMGQWNKIQALGLTHWFKPRLISVSADIGADKTSPLPWQRMEQLTPQCTGRWYIGDNPRKDFRHPRAMGWRTVMLVDDGRNIKPQNVPLPADYQAEHTVTSLLELPAIIESYLHLL